MVSVSISLLQRYLAINRIEKHTIHIQLSRISNLFHIPIMARRYLQPHYGNVYLSAGGKHCRHPIAVMDTFGLGEVQMKPPSVALKSFSSNSKLLPYLWTKNHYELMGLSQNPSIYQFHYLSPVFLWKNYLLITLLSNFLVNFLGIFLLGSI